MPGQNDIISPDDLRYNPADPVLYTSINLEKVIAGVGSDGDVTTIPSSGEAETPIENYPDENEDEVDLAVSNVSLKQEYNSQPETLLSAIQDAELDDRNMTDISSVFSSSSHSDYPLHYHQHLTINEGDDQVNEDSSEDVTQAHHNLAEGPDGGVVTTQQTVTDQTNVYFEFPIGEEASTVIPGSEIRTESDAVTVRAPPWTAGEREEPPATTESGPVIDVDDFSDYSDYSDDNNGRDETTQQDNSSVNSLHSLHTIMQFANISRDDSQDYQANTTGAPSGADHYEDETVTGVTEVTGVTDVKDLQGPPSTPSTPLLTLMQSDSEPQKLIFLIQRGPHRHSPDTKVGNTLVGQYSMRDIFDVCPLLTITTTTTTRGSMSSARC